LREKENAWILGATRAPARKLEVYMLRRLGLLGILLSLFLPVGCMTNRPVIWSWPHNKRKILTIVEQFHEFHMDFDRIVLDMEEVPLEDVE
jgi:hypothetical protein